MSHDDPESHDSSALAFPALASLAAASSSAAEGNTNTSSASPSSASGGVPAPLPSLRYRMLGQLGGQNQQAFASMNAIAAAAAASSDPGTTPSPHQHQLPLQSPSYYPPQAQQGYSAASTSLPVLAPRDSSEEAAGGSGGAAKKRKNSGLVPTAADEAAESQKAKKVRTALSTLHRVLVVTADLERRGDHAAQDSARVRRLPPQEDPVRSAVVSESVIRSVSLMLHAVLQVQPTAGPGGEAVHVLPEAPPRLHLGTLPFSPALRFAHCFAYQHLDVDSSCPYPRRGSRSNGRRKRRSRRAHLLPPRLSRSLRLRRRRHSRDRLVRTVRRRSHRRRSVRVAMRWQGRAGPAVAVAGTTCPSSRSSPSTPTTARRRRPTRSSRVGPARSRELSATRASRT